MQIPQLEAKIRFRVDRRRLLMSHCFILSSNFQLANKFERLYEIKKLLHYFSRKIFRSQRFFKWQHSS